MVLKEEEFEVVHCINLDICKDKRRTAVHMALKLRIPLNAGI